mmetsp:Transcript_117757/g.333786  ORF Transcript_117757/g.333786 Transcript_117757/m.333786 type:complete len:391 (-) Transcript_117757:850-2022(-)
MFSWSRILSVRSPASWKCSSWAKPPGPSKHLVVASTQTRLFGLQQPSVLSHRVVQMPSRHFRTLSDKCVSSNVPFTSILIVRSADFPTWILAPVNLRLLIPVNQRARASIPLAWPGLSYSGLSPRQGCGGFPSWQAPAVDGRLCFRTSFSTGSSPGRAAFTCHSVGSRGPRTEKKRTHQTTHGAAARAQVLRGGSQRLRAARGWPGPRGAAVDSSSNASSVATSARRTEVHFRAKPAAPMPRPPRWKRENQNEVRPRSEPCGMADWMLLSCTVNRNVTRAKAKTSGSVQFASARAHLASRLARSLGGATKTSPAASASPCPVSSGATGLPAPAPRTPAATAKAPTTSGPRMTTARKRSISGTPTAGPPCAASAHAMPDSPSLWRPTAKSS